MSKTLSRIMYIAPTDSKFAGDNLSLLRLIEGLRQQDISVFVVASSVEAAKLFEKAGAQTGILPYPEYRLSAIMIPIISIKNFLLFPALYFRELFKIITTTAAIAKFVSQFKPELIHSNTGTVISGYLLSYIFRIPHIWHVREYLDLDFDRHFLFTKFSHLKLLGSLNNGVVFVSNSVKQHYKNLGNSTVIYDGVLPSEKIRYSKEKEDYLLFVGRVNKNKGAKDLIDAFCEYGKNDDKYRLLIAGEIEPKFARQVKSIVEINHLEERIIFLGPRDDIDELMYKATAIIVPSKNEAFGRITAEAMFNGCLAIGRDTGGTREILLHDNAGIRFQTNHELATILLEISKNGISRYSSMIERGLRQASLLYTQERNINEMLKYYRKVSLRGFMPLVKKHSKGQNEFRGNHE